MTRHDHQLDPQIAAELEALERALADDAGADPMLSGLVREVRADAPTLRGTARDELDARVADGFPRAGGPRGAWLSRFAPSGMLFRPALAVAATAMLALVVTGAALRDGGDSSPAGSTVAALPEASDGRTGDSDGTRESATEAAKAVGSGGTVGTPVAADESASSPTASPPATTVARPSTPGVVGPSTADDAAEDLRPVVSGLSQPGALSGPRRVERSAEMTLSTAPDEVQSVADDVVRTVQSLDGVVASSNVSTVDGGGEAFFDLRLPTSRLDRAIAALSKLAHVSALTQDSQDITGAFVSAADRLKDARDERAALLKALSRATTDRQVSSLRARIADSRRRIASAEADLRRLRSRTDRATVGLTIRGDGESRGGEDENGDGAWTPGDAVDDALRVLEVAAGVAVIAAAALVPLGLLALLALVIARTKRRRSREQALDS